MNIFWRNGNELFPNEDSVDKSHATGSDFLHSPNAWMIVSEMGQAIGE